MAQKPGIGGLLASDAILSERMLSIPAILSHSSKVRQHTEKMVRLMKCLGAYQ